MNRLALALAAILFVLSPASARLAGVSGQDHTHVVRAGQSLLKIALHYSLAPTQVVLANGLESEAVRPGQVLRIPGRRIVPPNAPRDGILVNLAERMLYLCKSGSVVLEMPVAIGMPGRFKTPTGNFTIVSMVKNPTWLPPEWADVDETVVPAGADNPLGDRWIGLSAKGIGFHATAERTSVGTPASHGCMRMIPAMVEKLFENVSKQMPVHIVYETATFGYDLSSRQLLMAAFPDIYSQRPPLESAQKFLKQSGLDAFVDAALVKRIAQRHDGRATVLTTGFAVTLHGQSVSMTMPPLARSGVLWVPISVAKVAGATVRYDPRRKVIVVDRDKTELMWRLGTSSEADPSGGRLVGGETYVPARALLNGLRMPFSMDGHTLAVR